MSKIEIPFINVSAKIPLISVTVGSKADVIAIIDTGSDSTVISKEFVEKNSICVEKNCDRINFNGINSSETVPVTYAKSTITFSNLAEARCDAVFTVLDMVKVQDVFMSNWNICPDIILGSDFLDNHGAKIDYVESKLVIDDLSCK